MNLPPFVVIPALMLCALSSAQAPSLSDAKLRQIALRSAAPEELDRSAKRDLEAARASIEKRESDDGLARWKQIAYKLGEPDRAARCIDYLLNRAIVARSPAANEACRKLRFYDAQENAVFEHVSTLDKQLSAYGGADVKAVPLREPDLAEYRDGAEPVKWAPGISAGPKELKASLDRWNERLPAISASRAAALDAFVKAARGDAALLAEVAELDSKMRAAIVDAK